MSVVTNTINYLKLCQKRRESGYSVSFTTDPSWLVHMALNRRARWPDDPSFARGSCMPVNGKYPKKASGDPYNHLRLLARQINTPRQVVRVHECGEWRKLLLSRIPDRFYQD
jgi:hypothetical protein